MCISSNLSPTKVSPLVSQPCLWQLHIFAPFTFISTWAYFLDLLSKEVKCYPIICVSRSLWVPGVLLWWVCPMWCIWSLCVQVWIRDTQRTYTTGRDIWMHRWVREIQIREHWIFKTALLQPLQHIQKHYQISTDFFKTPLFQLLQKHNKNTTRSRNAKIQKIDIRI